MSQQRTQNNRGQLPVRTLAFAAALPWAFGSISNATLVINLPGAPSGVSLNGVPQFIRASDSAAPTSAAYSPGVLNLVYPSPIGAGESFEIGSKDPALRGPQGQWLDAGSVDAPAPPPIPDVQHFGAAPAPNPNTVIICDTDSAQITPGGSPAPSDWLVAVPLPDGVLGCTMLGTVTGNPAVPAGGTGIFVWDGAAWVRQ